MHQFVAVAGAISTPFTFGAGSKVADIEKASTALILAKKVIWGVDKISDTATLNSARQIVTSLVNSAIAAAQANLASVTNTIVANAVIYIHNRARFVYLMLLIA